MGWERATVETPCQDSACDHLVPRGEPLFRSRVGQYAFCARSAARRFGETTVPELPPLHTPDPGPARQPALGFESVRDILPAARAYAHRERARHREPVTAAADDARMRQAGRDA